MKHLAPRRALLSISCLVFGFVAGCADYSEPGAPSGGAGDLEGMAEPHMEPDDDGIAFKGFSNKPACGGRYEFSASAEGAGSAVNLSYDGAGDNAKGDAVANWLIENAQSIGVQLIIWDRTIWNPNHDQPSRCYGGEHPHNDHVHVELTIQAGERGTPFFNGGQVAPPSADQSPPRGNAPAPSPGNGGGAEPAPDQNPDNGGGVDPNSGGADPNGADPESADCADDDGDGYCDDPAPGGAQDGQSAGGCVDADRDGYCDDPAQGGAQDGADQDDQSGQDAGGGDECSADANCGDGGYCDAGVCYWDV